MIAVRRVFLTPQLWLLLAVTHWLIALSLSWPFRTAVFASVAPFSELRQPLVGICELIWGHSDLLPILMHTLVATTVVGFCFWMIASAGVIARLATSKPPMKVLQTTFLCLPHIAVTSCFALLLRGFLLICMTTALLRTAPIWIQIGFFLCGWFACTLALDIARVRIVLAKASGLHPKTLFQSFVLLARQPKRAAYATLVCVAHTSLLLGMFILAAYSLGHPWVIWLIRTLSIFSVGLSLWRIAIAIDGIESEP